MRVARLIERRERINEIEQSRQRLIDEHAKDNELLRACCEALDYVSLVLAIRCGRL